MKSIKFDNCDELWFTSDTHFDHENIINYCDRPFGEEMDMNRAMMENWNRVIAPTDRVFILGDFSFGNRDTWCWRLDHLNGLKYFIRGNHDRPDNIPRDKFVASIDGFMDILVKDPEIKHGQFVTLCHYPMLSWYQSHRGSWQLFGHVHGRLDKSDKIMPTQLDVGVDSHNFTPLSWRDVKTIITKQCLKVK